MTAFSNVSTIRTASLSYETSSSKQKISAMDNLIIQLERTNLQDTIDTAVSFQRTGAVATSISVDSTLRTDLSHDKEYGIITPSNRVFDNARKHAKNAMFGLRDDVALDNFLWLASGDLRYPIIILLNPSNDHTVERYEDMIRDGRELGPALQWVRETIQNLGLRMEDVCILDVYPLISDNHYKTVKKIKSESEVMIMLQQSFDITKALLAELKPKIILSCQCQTRQKPRSNRENPWSKLEDPFLESICSSLTDARNGSERTVVVGDHEMKLALGFHPSGLGYITDPRNRVEREEWLKRLFGRVYGPCASFKNEKLKRAAYKNLEEACVSVEIAEKALQHADSALDGYLETWREDTKPGSIDLRIMTKLRDTLKLDYPIQDIFTDLWAKLDELEISGTSSSDNVLEFTAATVSSGSLARQPGLPSPSSQYLYHDE